MNNVRSERAWDVHDTALWHTIGIVRAMLVNQESNLPVIAVPFAMQLGGQQERIFASGEFSLAIWAAPGDGSYLHSGGVFLATGAGGLALTAAFAGVQAMRNGSRRRQAEALARPRWLTTDRGMLHLGSHGFYLQTDHGLFPWDWGSVDSATVTGSGCVHIQGRSSGGHVSWMVTSHWAELLFMLWAIARHPRHPQIIDWSWLPPNWIQWATSQGYEPRDPWSAAALGPGW